jgi:L-lactate dehydrogenase complex protein LldG
MELLVDRLHDYDAQVLEVGRSEVADAVARRLTARGVRRLVVPAGLRADAWVDGFEFVPDDGLSAVELNAVDGVVTECTAAIAETGTIVLQNAPGQGRRAISLVPDYHLCIVDAAKVVETVPEAMERLAATAGLATTFISGPSATADIEMTRIKGVHGPRFLDVILVQESIGVTRS